MILALSPAVPQDIDALVDRLRSDSIEEREEASRRLTQFGRAVIPALKKARKRAGPEARGRLDGIVDDILRRERLLPVRPWRKRVSLDLKEVPLERAVREVLGRFGQKKGRTGFVGGLPKGKNISVKLDRADIWQAFDALREACSRAGISALESNAVHPHFWRIEAGSQPRRPAVTANFGGGRFAANIVVPWDKKIRYEKMIVYVRLILPPNYNPLRSRLQALSLKVGEEWKRALRTHPEGTNQFYRHSGGVTTNESFGTVFNRDAIKGHQTAEVRGTIIVTYPRDLERVEVSLDELKMPQSLRIPGVNFTLKKWEPENGGKEGSYQMVYLADDREPATRAFVWVEDAGGNWLVDLHGIQSRPGVASSASGSWNCDRPPSRLVIAIIKGEEDFTVPFLIRDVPIPAMLERPPPDPVVVVDPATPSAELLKKGDRLFREGLDRYLRAKSMQYEEKVEEHKKALRLLELALEAGYRPLQKRQSRNGQVSKPLLEKIKKAEMMESSCRRFLSVFE